MIRVINNFGSQPRSLAPVFTGRAHFERLASRSGHGFEPKLLIIRRIGARSIRKILLFRAWFRTKLFLVKSTAEAVELAEEGIEGVFFAI